MARLRASIIGAGISGLTVASRLKDKYDVTVYEQSNKIGGLCRTMQIDDMLCEFGVHILYTKTVEQYDFFTKILGKALTKDYFVNISIDGKLDSGSLYDFPITKENLARIGSSYNPKEPDYSNFEAYMVSQLGTDAYNQFIKNYNYKQWGIKPNKMSAEWAKFRPLVLFDNKVTMFGNNPSWHPCSYNRLFTELSDGVRLITDHKIDDFRELPRGNGDIIINTSPLFFLNKKWVDLAIVMARTGRLPDNITYSTTFPNNYKFTRMVAYDRQLGVRNSRMETVGWDFPINQKTSIFNKYFNIGMLGEIAKFANRNNIKLYNYAVLKEKFVYPISQEDITDNLKLIASLESVYSIGRQGLYSYISMANAWEKADLLATQILENRLDSYSARLAFYNKVRSDLW